MPSCHVFVADFFQTDIFFGEVADKSFYNFFLGHLATATFFFTIRFRFPTESCVFVMSYFGNGRI